MTSRSSLLTCSRLRLSKAALMLPCCVTGQHLVEVHHIRYPGITGVGKKSSDYFTIPLTPELHREFHTRGRREWELAYGSQIDHVTRTLKRLYP